MRHERSNDSTSMYKLMCLSQTSRKSESRMNFFVSLEIVSVKIVNILEHHAHGDCLYLLLYVYIHTYDYHLLE